jgi:hypothetical protein
VVVAIVTMLTLVLFAEGFRRLHRVAEANRESCWRAIVLAHAEWADAHGGTTLDPSAIGTPGSWSKVGAAAGADFDGHGVQIMTGEYRVDGEANSHESRTTCTVALSTERPRFSLRPRTFAGAVGRGIGPAAFDRQYVIHRPAHARAQLSAASRVLLIHLPDRLRRAVSLHLDGDNLHLTATGWLTSPGKVAVLANAALALATSIEGTARDVG